MIELLGEDFERYLRDTEKMLLNCRSKLIILKRNPVQFNKLELEFALEDLILAMKDILSVEK